MKTLLRSILVIGTLAVAPIEGLGVTDLQITVEQTNAVLSWASAAGDTFIVQYRADLDPSTPWTSLAAAWPAEAGTNRTRFVHANIVKQVGLQGGGGGGGGGAPPTPMSAAMLTDDAKAKLKEKRNKEPKEPPPLPPAPWDPKFLAPTTGGSSTLVMAEGTAAPPRWTRHFTEWSALALPL